MKPLEVVLGLWKSRLISTEQVTAWADRQIQESDLPPTELLDLSLDGPEKCLRRPSAEFQARPLRLDYVQEFSLRVSVLDLASTSDLAYFAEWAARRCMGEDVALPEVMLGIRLDDVLESYYPVNQSVQLLREALPELLSACNARAASIMSVVPGVRLAPRAGA